MVTEVKEPCPTQLRTESILFRCRPDLKKALAIRAEQEKRSVVDLMRDAIAERINFKGEL